MPPVKIAREALVNVSPKAAREPDSIASLVAEIAGCRACVERPLGSPLPHMPNPIFRIAATARICIASQAPGARAHASSIPFQDASGERLRAWLGVTPTQFYDRSRVAIVPMGFCFPGYDAKGGDMPPRRECEPLWRKRVLAALPRLELVLAIGQYAQAWHMGAARAPTLTATVMRWREFAARGAYPIVVPLPHPSWRNTGWLRRNPWFEAETLPFVRRLVRKIVET